jgi:hypothetical protein
MLKPNQSAPNSRDDAVPLNLTSILLVLSVIPGFSRSRALQGDCATKTLTISR